MTLRCHLRCEIVDGHRRYADEPERPAWYPGQSQPSPYDSGVYERPSGAFRLPAADGYAPDPVTSTGSHARPTPEPAPPTRTPVRGPEYPAVRPTSTPAPAGYNHPAPERSRESVYSTRRPASAVVVAIVTVLLMVPVVRLLFQAAFAHTPVAGSIVPAVLLTLGLPLTGAGLYALAGGGRPQTRDTWLRPPVAYLPTGLLLVLAAALAVA